MSTEQTRDVMTEIQQEISDNTLMIYMKGTPEMPRCGFSAAVVEVINSYGKPFGAVDVLADPDKWNAVRQSQNWPTIPMIFVGGEFIGGCDITREMHASGELAPMIAKAFGEG